MSSLAGRSEFLQGTRECLPIIIAIIPVGLLFGAVAITSGLTGVEAFVSSLTMYTAAAQFLFLEVNGVNIPLWSIALAVFAVAFRHVLYSAALARSIKHFPFAQKITSLFLLTDPSFASAEARADSKGLTANFYFGYGVPLYLTWVTSTLIGIYFGGLIEDPKKFGFDFLVPMYFLILLMGFRSRSGWLWIVLVSGISSVILFKLIGPPWHISLGALAGILLAALSPLPNKKSS